MKLNKPATTEQYAELAIYCNENNYQIIDQGEFYESVPCNPKPEPTYVQKRAAAYPAIKEQLDMIYWDKINGTNLWQEKITEIKTKYPKE